MQIKLSVITIFILFCFSLARSQQSKRSSREDYFRSYFMLAVEEMNRVGIPASITLAQGAFESDDGNSYLAKKANNHFGIKCKGKWTGETIIYDDDAKNECFRKYNSVLDSYKDHSDFLVNGSRYDFLFQLGKKDYKAWAEGLKKAGYATNPKYAIQIIKIIEDNKLYLYDDLENYQNNYNNNEISSAKNSKKKSETHILKKRSGIDDFAINPLYREVFKKNKVSYIKVKKGDTFYKISKEFNLSISQLLSYNDLINDSSILAGQVLYIEPKRFRAERSCEYHFVDPGETLYSISQYYAIRLNSLRRKNILRHDDKIKPGEKLWLRKKKKIN